MNEVLLPSQQSLCRREVLLRLALLQGCVFRLALLQGCVLRLALLQGCVLRLALLQGCVLRLALSRGRFSLCSERRVSLLYLEAFALGNNHLFLGKSNGKYSVLVFGADAVLVYSFKAEGALKGAIAALAADVAVGLVLRISLLFRFKGQLAVLDLGGYIVAGEAGKLCFEKIAISLIQNVGLKGGSLMPEKAFLNADWLEEWVEERKCAFCAYLGCNIEHTESSLLGFVFKFVF